MNKTLSKAEIYSTVFSHSDERVKAALAGLLGALSEAGLWSIVQDSLKTMEEWSEEDGE